jgi:integrase/recombinase XerC
VGNLPAHALELPILTALLAKWRGQYAYSYFHQRFHALKRFLRWAQSFGAPATAHQLGRIRRPQPRQVIATTEERGKLLAAAEPWLRCWILLCSDLALRFSEARQIRPSSWNREQHTIRYVKKGGDEYTLPLSDELEQLFALAPQEDDLPFIDALHGQRHRRAKSQTISDDAIRNAWERLKAKTHANAELRPHDLRRTTAVLAYEHTKDIRAVQQLLGHRSLSTTAEYLAHRDTEKLRPLIDALKQKPITEVKQ